MSDEGSEVGSEVGGPRAVRRSLPTEEFILTGNPNLLGLPYLRQPPVGTRYREDDQASLMGSGQYPSVGGDSDEGGSGVELARAPTTRYGTWQPAEEGITLTWRDLSVYVPQKKSWSLTQSSPRPFKRVLNSVFGAVTSGSLVALMGASGAGKSTLMNALAHRTGGGVAVDGEILVNGRRATRAMNAISGYVHQDDLFVGSLTVLEHLSFMARLRMDASTSRRERETRVQELVKELGLSRSQHTRIGAPGMDKALSGGERKRLAFASEILTDPPLLFCDEPTSGLDSFNARKLVRMMREMAARGKTILCTIHQPSTDLFLMFDRLILLAEGRLAYLGSSTGAMQFFESLEHRCPSTFNPADFYIHVLAVQPGHELASRERIRRVCDNFAVSPQAALTHDTIRRHDAHATLLDTQDDTFTVKNTPRPPGWCVQLYWLTWRAVVDSCRNPAIHAIRILQKILMAVLIGVCFTSVQLNQAGVQDIEGVLFIFITENTFPSVYAVLNVFPQELPLFLREYRNGIYRSDTYYLAKMLSLMPGFICDPVIFVTICYWMVGLRHHLYHYLMTLLVLVFTANTASACGAMFSSMFESIPYIMVLLIPFDMMLLITGGLFINLGTLSPYIGWVKHLSWFMYSNEASTIIQWKGVTNITCETPVGVPCLRTGAEVIHKYTFHSWRLPLDLAMMAVLYLAFHIVGFLGLLSRARRK